MTQTLNSGDLKRDEISEELYHFIHTVPDSELPKFLQFFGQILQSDPDHLDALYGYGVASLRMMRMEQADYHFRRAYQRAPGHIGLWKSLINVCYQTGAYEDTYNLSNALLAHINDDPELYGMLHGACLNLNRRDDIRRFRKMMAEHCTKGYHAQPNTIASLKEIDPDLHAKLSSKPKPPVSTNRSKPGKPAQKAPSAVTGDATIIGGEGLTLNGAIGGSTLSTRYHFRYGTAPDKLDRTTEECDLPPGRHGRVVEQGSNPFHRINPFPFSVNFRKIKEGAAMALLSPYGKDRNHINGIGIVDLLLGWSSAVHVRDRVGDEYTGGPYPWKIYPGESLDLRDAEFSVVLRSDDLDARDFRLVAWFHANAGTALVPENMEDLAPWALTADLQNNQIIPDNKWRELTFRFRDNSNDWSFSGNNVEEMGPQIGRYLYHPLGKSLSQNRGNICLCFVCGNEVDTPEGEIELASMSLRYRSRSLLGPGYGGVLINAPDKGSDPATLSDGWIGGEADFWQSALNPKAAQEFTWKFADKTSIDSVRLHQNHHWPAKEFEVLVSTNGKKFTPLWTAELRADAAGTVDGPEDLQEPGPKNLASIHIPAKPVKASHLKLRILSGYDPKHWGLDAIEVFGQGPRPIPETEPCSVSEEITGFTPGTEVFYQMVAENEKGPSEGVVKSLVIPADMEPIIHEAKVLDRTKDKVTLVARVTAMGAFTELTGVLVNSKGKTVYEGSVTAGKWPTPRHVTLPMTGLTAKGKFKATLTAVNETGESAALTIKIGSV